MSKNNHSLFLNIIKNAGPDFKFKEELIQLHSRAIQLESSINLRCQIEYQYNNLKLEEVKERIDEIEFQKKFFIKRNNDILETLQKNQLKNLEFNSNYKAFYHDLEIKKKEYEQFIDSIIPDIIDKFNIELSKDVLLEEKKKEIDLFQKLERRNNYYVEMIKENEILELEIENLRKKNLEIIKINKEKEEKFIESKNKLKNKLAENNKFDINEYYQENKNKNDNALEELNVLNNINKKKKDSIISENSSLYELRKQIINPEKKDFYENLQNPPIFKNTLDQTFGKPNLNDDDNDNNINKIENITPGILLKEDNNTNNENNNESNINNPNNAKDSKNEPLKKEGSVNSEFADYEVVES